MQGLWRQDFRDYRKQNPKLMIRTTVVVDDCHVFNVWLASYLNHLERPESRQSHLLGIMFMDLNSFCSL